MKKTSATDTFSFFLHSYRHIVLKDCLPRKGNSVHMEDLTKCAKAPHDRTNMGMRWSVVNFRKELVLKVVLQRTAAIIEECTKYPHLLVSSLYLFGLILRASFTIRGHKPMYPAVEVSASNGNCHKSVGSAKCSPSPSCSRPNNSVSVIACPVFSLCFLLLLSIATPPSGRQDNASDREVNCSS